MTKQELEEQSEKIVKDTFKEGEPWQYASYMDGLADVFLDGNFDLRELVEKFVELSEKAIAEERKRIVDIIENCDRFSCGACDSKVSNLSHTLQCIFRDHILSLINKDN